MRISVLDRIFWFRAGLGTVVGILADYLFGADYSKGIVFAAIVYVASYYAVSFLWAKQMKPGQNNKLITTAIGTYILVFLFVWIFCFTIGLGSLGL